MVGYLTNCKFSSEFVVKEWYYEAILGDAVDENISVFSLILKHELPLASVCSNNTLRQQNYPFFFTDELAKTSWDLYSGC